MQNKFVKKFVLCFAMVGIYRVSVAPACDELQVNVRGLAGSVCSFDAHSEWTIGQVKWKIEEKTGNPANLQQLRSGITRLKDDVTLGSLSSPDSRNITLTLVANTPSNIDIDELVQKTSAILPKDARGHDARPVIVGRTDADRYMTLQFDFWRMKVKMDILKELPVDTQNTLVVILCNALTHSVDAPDGDYRAKLAKLLEVQDLDGRGKEVRGFNVRLAWDTWGYTRSFNSRYDFIITKQQDAKEFFKIEVSFNSYCPFAKKFLWFLSENNYAFIDLVAS